METRSEDVVIVGAGVAGLATAIALKRVGVRALVLERSPELRASGAAVNLFPNAWVALHALGVAHKLTSVYPPLEKGHIFNVVTGATTDVSFSAMDRTGRGVRPVHRKLLVEALAEELPADAIRFSSKVATIETQQLDNSLTSMAVLHLEDGTIIKAKVLIGCDGVHSVVARWLGLKEPVYSGRYAVLGLSKFPEGHELKHDFHQFLGEALRAGCIPLSEKEVSWFMTFRRSTGEMIREPEQIQKIVIEEVKGFPARYLDVVRRADLDTLYWVPLMLRVPWDIIIRKASKGPITVAGDAMHPMTPDLGQGAGSALEDAVVLGRHIGNSFLQKGGIVAGEIEGALESYVKERRWRAAGLITGAYISGLSQQGGSPWMKFLRDLIVYKILFLVMARVARYDCGKLPTASSHAEKDNKQA